MHVNFRWMIDCLLLLGIVMPISVYGADRESEILSGLIVDAQEENRSKIVGGLMRYRVTHEQKGSARIEVESSVRWDAERAFWTYKISDPDKVVTGNQALAVPLAESPSQYMLRIKDRLYLFNAATNTLHLTRFEYPTNTGTSFYLFDVFPESLWSRCCPPFHSFGRRWVELTGKSYESLMPGSTVSMERISSERVRQVRNEPGGATTKIEFSLADAGNVVLLERQNPKKPEENSRVEYHWQKKEGVTLLKGCRVIRGDILNNEKNANEIFDLKVESITLIKGKVTTDFAALKSLLPKNSMFVDHVQNRSQPLFPENQNKLTDESLKKLGERVKNEGLIRP